jgi:nitroimidazol reductase NimA-like FMN-containing flavoprotein (pyridoxamine 5'-phosphate oxidase superfamily)
MSLASEPVTVLSEDECWFLLASRTLGRLGTVVAGQPEIFPVNFVVQRPTVLFRTSDGRNERAQLLTWTPNVKQHYVRIAAAEITGRRFRFGTEPERDC